MAFKTISFMFVILSDFKSLKEQTPSHQTLWAHFADIQVLIWKVPTLAHLLPMLLITRRPFCLSNSGTARANSAKTISIDIVTLIYTRKYAGRESVEHKSVIPLQR